MTRRPYEVLLEEMRQHAATLMANLDDAQGAVRTLADELREVGRQHELIANLYVQLERLHGSVRLPDVIEAVNETLTNLLGSEDFALFWRDDAANDFEKLAWVGERAGALADFRLGEGPLGIAATRGAITYGADPAAPVAPVAIIPLAGSLRQGCVGVVAVMGLLQHRGALGERDRALLEAFAAHAAVALESATCAALAGSQTVEVARLRELIGTQGGVPAQVLDLRGAARR